MSMQHYLAVLAVTLLGAVFLRRLAFIKRMNGGRSGGQEGMLRLLPPGSRGLPLLGETLEFLAASPTLDLVPFFKRRLERFGPIFRTNLIGEDLIVSLDPELNARVLHQEERGFQIWYPSSFMRVLGANNLASTLGPLHRHIKNLVRRLFGPEVLRLVLLHDVQRSARDELRSWLDRSDVEVRTATSRMIFAVTAKKLISHDDTVSGGSLWKCFDAWTKGLMSFPICIPGTSFYKCMQGRKNVMKVLKQQLDERWIGAERKTVDFFDLVIDEINKPNPTMNVNIALDLLFLLLFASHETTSMALTAILKFLTEPCKN